jgi:hypothetical protein
MLLIILLIGNYWQILSGYRVYAPSSTLDVVGCSKYFFSQPTNNGRSQEQNAARGGFVDVLWLITAVPIRLVADGG